MTGESFFLETDKCNKDTFGDYLKQLSQTFPNTLNLLLVD